MQLIDFYVLTLSCFSTFNYHNSACLSFILFPQECVFLCQFSKLSFGSLLCSPKLSCTGMLSGDHFLTIVSEPMEALVVFVMISDLHAFSRVYFLMF